MKFLRSLRRSKSTKKEKEPEPVVPPKSTVPARQTTSATTESAPARINGPSLPSPKERPGNQRRIVSDRTPLHPNQRNSSAPSVSELLKPFEFTEVVDRYPRAFLSPRSEFTSASLHGNRNSGVFYDEGSVAGIGLELGRTKSMRGNGIRDYGPDSGRAMTFSGQDPRRHTYLAPSNNQYQMSFPPPHRQPSTSARPSPTHTPGASSPHLTPDPSRRSSPQPPHDGPNDVPPLPRNLSANSLHQPQSGPGVRRRVSHSQLYQGPPMPHHHPHPPMSHPHPPLSRRPSRRPMPPPNGPASYGPPLNYGGPPMPYGSPPPHMYGPPPQHMPYMPGPPPMRHPSQHRGGYFAPGPPSPHRYHTPPRPVSSQNPTVSHLPETLPDLPESQQNCMNLHLQFIPVKPSKTSPATTTCELCSRTNQRSLSACSSCALRLCPDCKLLVKTAGDIKGVEEMVMIIRAEEAEQREREASESSANENGDESAVSTGSSGRSSWVGDLEMKNSAPNAQVQERPAVAATA